MEQLSQKNIGKIHDLRSSLDTVLRPLNDFTTKGKNVDAGIQSIISVGSNLNVDNAAGLLSDVFGYNDAISQKLAESIKNGSITNLESFYNAVDFYN
jgi:hypothetical protein